ncbi:YceI family protein [Leptospira idonii]|uniref:YceI family protein n=1 Tax=Leptospira idonii TaxID=1193500 RepID=A0A4R9LYQ5_9LEPT|nr:YceI family protein [Leptospira idonii]TGN18497.1 YceI family protein [Leptospira idonii]
MKWNYVFLSVILFSTAVSTEAQSLWKIESGKIQFKSESKLETIYGEGETVSGFLDPKTKQIQVIIDLKDFSTDNRLQTSHLQDNYLETHIHPKAIYIGEVKEVKETGEVTALGSLELHGVKREKVSLTGTVAGSSGRIELQSLFEIRLEDYKIEVPKMLFYKISPEIKVRAKIIFKKEG